MLKRGRVNWNAEIYRSLAVYDKQLSEKSEASEKKEADVDEKGETTTSQRGYSVDIASSEDVPNHDEEEEEDELVLAALESLDVIDVMKHGELSDMHSSAIPYQNFRKLVELLLLIAPIQIQEHISRYSTGWTDERLSRLREVASCILYGFTEEPCQSISFRTFKRTIADEVPYLFDSLKPLFESFLFDKKFDLSKHKDSQPSNAISSQEEPKVDMSSSSGKGATAILEEGDILDGTLLSQLSFFINGEKLFHRLRLLYTGGEAGFSMGSFEKHVFNWNAPSILLISGTILDEEPSNIRQRSFVDSLPSKRLPSSAELRGKSQSSSSSSKHVVYGAYIPTAWQATHKYCFGDSSTLLFQLSPVHDIYTASSISKDYVYYNKPPTATAAGLGLGTPIAKTSSVLGSRHSVTSPTSSSFSASSLSSTSHLHLGPVSLHLDDALEFGVFTHLGSTGGGSFQPSKIASRRGRDWQDRFSIESLEVWGCDAGDEEAERQRKRWEWEEREAEMRRKINLGGTGDVEADRELLTMAGIIGGHRSGGSVG